MKPRRPVLLFDLDSGADDEAQPVVRFRIVAFTGGPPPDFLPKWEEKERMELHIVWAGDMSPYHGDQGIVFLGPRAACSTIQGFIERNKSHRLGSVYASVAYKSPGSMKALRALFRMHERPFPWRLTKFQLPNGIVEAVEL